MQIDYQSQLIELIKLQLTQDESIGNSISEVLSISPDAAYRRFRGETPFTINELQKISKHFGISLDNLFGIKKNNVSFEYQPLSNYDFTMEGYLEGILRGLKFIKAQSNPALIISINNTPLIQLLNFPHLIRFKLFFWAKTHLQIEDYANIKFIREKPTEKVFLLGREVLQHYNSIPSRELLDPELLRGFIREIQYYFSAQHFEDPNYAIYLMDQLLEFVSHLKEQTAIGKKFIYGTQPPADGNNFEVYHNDVLNGITSTYYKTDETTGLYIAHNFLNTLHTLDQVYVEESAEVLEKQLANASLISLTNEKERNSYFKQLENAIERARKQMELEIE